MRTKSREGKTRKEYSVSLFIIEIALVLLACLVVFPVALIFINSFKENGQILSNMISLPDSLGIGNYVEAIAKMDFPRKFLNTVLISILSVGGIILFASMAAYKIIRVKSRVSNVIYYGILFTMAIPFQVLMVPVVIVARNMYIVNTMQGMIFMYWGFLLPMALFLYCGFIKGVPRDLEEAAMIDGCGQFRAFFYVVFPILKPITATIAIINILGVFNDFMLPLVMISSEKLKTIQLSMSVFYGTYVNRWDLIMAALVLSILPALIFFLLFQKQIIKGMADGAVKG